MFRNIIEYAIQSWVSITVQIFLTFLTFILIRYKYKYRDNQTIVLNQKAFKRLIEMFQSSPIVENTAIPYKFGPIKANFSNFDVFNLGKKHKEIIKERIFS